MVIAAKKKPDTSPGEPIPIANFEAYIPPIKSAMLFGSDGAQVKLEIPGTDLKEALKLAEHGQGKVLRVVVLESTAP